MYGNRYTRLTYRHEGDKISKLSESSDDEETETDVRWMSFRQHFFSTILASDEPFASVDMTSKNLVEEESKDVQFTKEFGVQMPVDISGGDFTKNLHWYYGPTDIDVLENTRTSPWQTPFLTVGVFLDGSTGICSRRFLAF